MILSLVDGIFSGLFLNDKELPIYPPLPFIVPMSIGLAVLVLGKNFANRPRKQLLAITLIPAVVVYIIYGVVRKNLVFAYILWMACLIAVGAFDIQVTYIHMLNITKVKIT